MEKTPDVDEYVDKIINKTYEKQEQFSSVYVTSTVNLEKVLDKMNVDDDIKEAIVPEEEKTIKEEIKEATIVDEPVENEMKEPVLNNLDILKNKMEEKKKEMSNKQDDLKSKLDALKKEKEEKTNLDDLKNKLDALKNEKE